MEPPLRGLVIGMQIPGGPLTLADTRVMNLVQRHALVMRRAKGQTMVGLPARISGKLPLVRAWIDGILAKHASRAHSVQEAVDEYGLNRLPLYFDESLLRRSKFVLVDEVPVPPLSALVLLEFAVFEKGGFSGITYRDTYFLRRRYAGNEALHFHELIHVIQWERLGTGKFLRAYAAGLLRHAYRGNPLEAMAYRHQRKFMTDPARYSVTAAVLSELSGTRLDATR
jgi:hypothetical protein